MERSGALLTRVTKVLPQPHQRQHQRGLTKIKSDEAPKLAAHSDAIFLNAKLFARVKALYDNADALKLDPESRYLVERYYKTFVRAGALLSKRIKRLCAVSIRKKQSSPPNSQTTFWLKPMKGAVVIDNKADLDGLSESDIAAAAETRQGNEARRQMGSGPAKHARSNRP